jgi:hypothetical protein
MDRIWPYTFLAFFSLFRASQDLFVESFAHGPRGRPTAPAAAVESTKQGRSVMRRARSVQSSRYRRVGEHRYRAFASQLRLYRNQSRQNQHTVCFQPSRGRCSNNSATSFNQTCCSTELNHIRLSTAFGNSLFSNMGCLCRTDPRNEKPSWM